MLILPNLGDTTQLDCVDEAVNTWTYMSLMERGNLLHFHRVAPLSNAGSLTDPNMRNTAVLEEIKDSSYLRVRCQPGGLRQAAAGHAAGGLDGGLAAQGGGKRGTGQAARPSAGEKPSQACAVGQEGKAAGAAGEFLTRTALGAGV